MLIYNSITNLIICITPKIACSEILDFVRWTQLGLKACDFQPTHIYNYSKFCENTLPRDSHRRYEAIDVYPLKFCRWTWDCMQEKNKQFLIPVRDPWNRFLSAFHDKIEIYNDYNFIPWMSRDTTNTSSLFDNYITSIVERPYKLNEHFMLQKDQCLAESILNYNSIKLLDIENHGLNEISSYINTSKSFEDMMGHQYTNMGKVYCYNMSIMQTRQVFEFLKADYDILRQYNITFASEQLKTVNLPLTVCPSNKKVTIQSSPNSPLPNSTFSNSNSHSVPYKTFFDYISIPVYFYFAIFLICCLYKNNKKYVKI